MEKGRLQRKVVTTKKKGLMATWDDLDESPDEEEQHVNMALMENTHYEFDSDHAFYFDSEVVGVIFYISRCKLINVIKEFLDKKHNIKNLSLLEKLIIV